MDKGDIKEIMQVVWKEIEGLFLKGKIYNERTLQAAIYSQITRQRSDLLCLIEPKVHLEKSERDIVPDILLAEKTGGRNYRAVLVAELKFVPFWWSKYLKDLEKLLFLMTEPSFPLSLCNHENGEGTKTGEIEISGEQLVTAFCVVSRCEAEAVHLADIRNAFQGKVPLERILLARGVTYSADENKRPCFDCDFLNMDRPCRAQQE
jgi:hypothetical protein